MTSPDGRHTYVLGLGSNIPYSHITPLLFQRDSSVEEEYIG